MSWYMAQSIVAALNALRLEIRASSWRARAGTTSDNEVWAEINQAQFEADTYARMAENLIQERRLAGGDD
jgi:hypothetical protein